MMQFMPNTGPSFNVFPDSPPAVQIDAGMRYIDQALQCSGTTLSLREQRLKVYARHHTTRVKAMLKMLFVWLKS